MSTVDTEHLHTFTEVQDLLRCSGQTVRRLIHQGQLPHVRIGRRVYVKASDLDEFIESHTFTGVQA